MTISNLNKIWIYNVAVILSCILVDCKEDWPNRRKSKTHLILAQTRSIWWLVHIFLPSYCFHLLSTGLPDLNEMFYCTICSWSLTTTIYRFDRYILIVFYFVVFKKIRFQCDKNLLKPFLTLLCMSVGCVTNIYRLMQQISVCIYLQKPPSVCQVGFFSVHLYYSL